MRHGAVKDLVPLPGIGVNLSIVFCKDRITEISPPFEGGVDAPHR